MTRPTIFRFLIGLASAGLAAGCSPAAVLNSLSQPEVPVARTQYGNDARNGVDIYRPAGNRNAPVIVFFYGGSWENGDKADYKFVGASLAARGYVVVIPDYRVYPQVGFDGFMADGASAVAWTKRNIARFGGDPSRLFVMGHSAGAHIAAMLTLDAKWLSANGMNARRDIAGLIGLAGPYDFLPLGSDKLRRIFAGGDIARTQPINFVSAGAPPALLLHGRTDTTVLPRNTERLAARLRGAGNRVTAKYYPAIGHAEIIGAVAPVLKPLAPVADDVDNFIRRHAGGGVQSPGGNRR